MPHVRIQIDLGLRVLSFSSVRPSLMEYKYLPYISHYALPINRLREYNPHKLIYNRKDKVCTATRVSFLTSYIPQNSGPGRYSLKPRIIQSSNNLPTRRQRISFPYNAPSNIRYKRLENQTRLPFRAGFLRRGSQYSSWSSIAVWP